MSQMISEASKSIVLWDSWISINWSTIAIPTSDTPATKMGKATKGSVARIVLRQITRDGNEAGHGRIEQSRGPRDKLHAVSKDHQLGADVRFAGGRNSLAAIFMREGARPIGDRDIASVDTRDQNGRRRHHHHRRDGGSDDAQRIVHLVERVQGLQATIAKRRSFDSICRSNCDKLRSG